MLSNIESKRNRKLILVIGGVASGKTTFIFNNLKKLKEKCIIYDINREEIYKKLPVVSLEKIGIIKKGKWRNICKDPDIFFSTILKKYRNGILICDDFDRYQSVITDDIRSLVIGYRHLGLDVILVFHSLARVLPIVYENCSDIFLFKTSEQPDRSIYKIPNYEKVIEKFNVLQNSENFTHFYISIR